MKLSRPENKEQWRLQLVQNAAFAALESSKRAALRDYVSRAGHAVIYVYDTDIIVTNCAPWRQGPVLLDGKRWTGGYGQVLPLKPTYDLDVQEHLKISGKEARQAEAVAQLIAKHALKARLEGGRKHPIYQLPAHFKETSKRYDSVRRGAEAFERGDPNSIVKRAVFTVFGAIVVLRDMVANTPAPDREIGAYTLSIVRKIIERTRSPIKMVREWDRFYALNVNDGGIFSTDEFMWPGVDPPGRRSSTGNIITECLTKELSKNESDQKDRLAAQAEPLIKQQKGRLAAEKSTNSATDADAMADLFLLNKRLKDANANCRVVLVTGDRNMSQLFFSDFEPGREIDHELAKNFGRDCVHHHWSFVDEMAVALNGQVKGARESKAADTDGKLSDQPPDFFSGLLAFRDDPIPEPANKDSDFLRQKQDVFYVICTAEKQSRYDKHLKSVEDQAIEAAYDRWAEFTDRAVVAAELDTYSESTFVDTQKLKDAVINVIQKSVQGEEINWERLQNEVTEVVIRARDRSNVVFSDIGADVLMAARENGVRNPPDLMLDRLNNTNAIFDNLASPNNVYDTVERFNADFARITFDCHDSSEDDDDRQEVYLKYLVLGALVASAERWSVAEEHARNAIAIIERARRSKKPIPVREDVTAGEAESYLSGREAYFLRSIASRLLAKGVGDLARAQGFLSIARDRLKEDRDKGAAGIPFIRFDNENLALALSGYYWKRMSDPNDFCNEEVGVIDGAVRTLLDERSRLKANSEDPVSLIGDRYGSIKPVTLVSIATNFIQVKVIWSFRESHLKVDPECPVGDELLRSSLEDIYLHSDILEKLSELELAGKFRRRQADDPQPMSICSPLILRYAAVGAQLLADRNGRYWHPVTVEEVDILFGENQNSTRYDTWRYPSLKDFSRQMADAGNSRPTQS
jgi:hypothetical protein